MAEVKGGRRAGGWVGLIVVACAIVYGIVVSGPQAIFESYRYHHRGTAETKSILSIFAREAFDWSSSTTPAPLSATAVLVKAILADKSALPPGLDGAIRSVLGADDTSAERVLDVQVGPVRDFVSSRVLREVQQLCSSSSPSSVGGGCNPNEVDPEFGTTPLHLAELWGSRGLAEYLLSIGADPEIFDTVGRQPRNMTFQAFSANSKKAAIARLPPGVDPEDRCEIPEVSIPLFPRTAIEEAALPSEKSAVAIAWQESAQSALSEVRRLVSEGEPVMVRNVVPWLLADSSGQGARGEPAYLDYRDAAAFVQAWGDRPVDVGGVPYAKNFDLYNERTTLKDYMASAGAAAAAAARTDTAGKDVGVRPPNYVFQVDTEACVEGRELLGRIVEAALPSAGEKPIVCPPPSGLRGLESVHYYLGGRWSGAPFHIHSDALNLVVSGRKKWWMVTPRSAVWSRRHIQEYAEEGKGGPGEYFPGRRAEASGDVDRPMECVQGAGDLVYVPGDWGHAAMNLEAETFGYTLELVNRRDTLASVLGMGCER